MKRKENKMELSIHSAKTVRSEAFAAAVVATDKYITQYLAGHDQFDCGFAWVTVQPKHKAMTYRSTAIEISILNAGISFHPSMQLLTKKITPQGLALWFVHKRSP